jgi:tetratricopeptide (TPR) repeat protein
MEADIHTPSVDQPVAPSAGHPDQPCAAADPPVDPDEPAQGAATEPPIYRDTDEPEPEMDAEACHDLAVDLQNLGRLAEAEAFYRAALGLDAERGDSWANLGLVLLRLGRAEAAVDCEREALRHDPDNIEALNNLGIAMHALNALSEAENHFRAILRLVPDHANAMLNLGVTRQSLGHLEEAETLYRCARALGADTARVCNNMALALAELDRLEAAETACRDALAANPDYPEAAVNLGMILLMRGKMAEAWPHYEARWRVAPLGQQAQLPAATRWTGQEPVYRRTILLLAEQGFGDALQFCRYAPMLARRGAKVIIAVPTALGRLMRSLQGIHQVVSPDDALPEFDLHCPLLSLPLAFGTTEATIPWRVPYLEADADAIERWQRVIPSAGDGGLRVGLVWAGARRAGQPHAAAIDRRRSMTLAALAPLAEVPGCVFVSLQLGPPARQTAAAPFPLVDVADRLTDFADTAALIEVLDLVVTVDTAVAHLAGALGKPVWLLNRFDACWRWPRDRDDSAWYPTMRLFRQTSPGDWDAVARRVAAALPGFRTYG